MGKLIIIIITYITIITKIKKKPILPYIKPHMVLCDGFPPSLVFVQIQGCFFVEQ